MSMGGMIAQRLAIDYPAKIITLTSVSSSGDPLDQECASGLKADARACATTLEEKYPYYQTDEDQAVAYRMEAFRLFAGSRFVQDEALLKSLLKDNIHHRNGYNPVANLHQSTAIVKSGSRLDELGRISAPTLIIHGTEDPLLHHDHSAKCARLIPGAKLVLLEGVGHEMPQGILPEIHDAVLNLFKCPPICVMNKNEC
jgi:pimeloyl-ACP methyl ester carboxylesterase